MMLHFNACSDAWKNMRNSAMHIESECMGVILNDPGHEYSRFMTLYQNMEYYFTLCDSISIDEYTFLFMMNILVVKR